MDSKKQRAAALYSDVKEWLTSEYPSPVHLVTAPIIEEWSPAWVKEGDAVIMKIDGMLPDGEKIRTSAVALLDRHLEWARTKNRTYRLGQQAGIEIPLEGVWT